MAHICNLSTLTVSWEADIRGSLGNLQVSLAGTHSAAKKNQKRPWPNNVEGENWFQNVLL